MAGRALRNVLSLAVLTIAALWLAGCGLGQPGGEQEPAPEDRVPLSTGSPEARRLYEEAVDLLDKQRRFDAAHLFGLALEHDPGLALAHRGLGMTLTSSKARFKALERAESLAQGASEAEQLLIVASRAASQADLEGEGVAFEQLVALHPRDPRPHYLLAHNRLRRGRLDEALQHFDDCLALDPSFAPAYNLQGYTLRGLGRYEAAGQAFERYIELEPDEPNPYDSYAELLLKMGRFEDSIDHYQQALDRNPGFVPSMVGIGNNLMFLGRSEEARQIFDELYEIARSPSERRDAVYWATAARLHAGELEAALEEAERLVELAAEEEDPIAEAEGQAMLGQILLEQGELELARSRFDQAMATVEAAEISDELEQRFQLGYRYLLGRLACASGALDEAEEHLQALRQEPSPRTMGAVRLWADELAGRIHLARGAWDAAVEVLLTENGDLHEVSGPPVAFYLAARARWAQGRTDEARDLVEKAAGYNQVNPDFAFVRPRAQALEAEIRGRRPATSGDPAGLGASELAAGAEDLGAASQPAHH